MNHSGITAVDIIATLNKSTKEKTGSRVMTQGIEIGAGWTKKGKSSGKYFESPALAIFDFDPLTLPSIGHDWCAQIQQAQTSLLKNHIAAYSWPCTFRWDILNGIPSFRRKEQ